MDRLKQKVLTNLMRLVRRNVTNYLLNLKIVQILHGILRPLLKHIHVVTRNYMSSIYLCRRDGIIFTFLILKKKKNIKKIDETKYYK